MYRSVISVFAIVATVAALGADLRSQKVRTIVIDSVNDYLQQSIAIAPDTGFGYLDQGEVKMEIRDAEMIEGAAVAMTIFTTGVAMTFDHEFGDPVNEYDISCLTYIEREDQTWKATETSCEY